jgi:hypothetical protein
MFKWFDTTEVDALTARMVGDLTKRVPPETFEEGGKKAAAKRDRTHDLVLRQAHEFARQRKLNVYTKARLANGFKWALLQAGYPKDFVDRMTIELAGVVASAKSERS